MSVQLFDGNRAEFFKGKTHDLTNRGWGRDYTFDPKEDGLKGRMMGWTRGINKGDYLILQNGNETTRYQVLNIEYAKDPTDMFFADVQFAPREEV
jgi:hypothetical protein